MKGPNGLKPSSTVIVSVVLNINNNDNKYVDSCLDLHSKSGRQAGWLPGCLDGWQATSKKNFFFFFVIIIISIKYQQTLLLIAL